MKYTTWLQHIIYFFITTQSCYAMEKEIIPFKINNHILSTGYTYFSKKCIYNNSNKIPCINNHVTGQTITIDGLQTKFEPIMYDNGTKMIFHCNDNTAKVYDITENKIIQSIKPIGKNLVSIIHSSFDNSISLISKDTHITPIIEVYNVKQDKYYENFFYPFGVRSYVVFIFHPKKPCLFYIQKTNEVFMFEYESRCLTTQLLQFPASNYILDTHKVSPEGYIAIRNNNKPTISILHLDNINSLFYELKDKENEYFWNMQFCPKKSKSILAIMSYNQNNKKIFMHYWDITKKEYIDTVNLSEISNNLLPSFFYFSYNGNKLILPYLGDSKAINPSGSFIRNIPFNVKYEWGTKEKWLYLSLVLNHIAPIILDNQPLPQDLLNYIKKIYLRLFKS